METAINYWWVLPIFIVLIILVGWMIRRNVKDEKEYERELMKSEMKPRKHDDNSVNKP